ncbi:MAG: hypothetical protein UX10_C0001G0056 [Candidatus Magasanikbacteria bacterium GW2011_GWA2_45_39]|uniref:Transcriptional regulator MraZ n=2 Tax=Candidatus Magasanikiibacteriota TaxID=1752731 RepID=A0A0G1MJM6_9BACT|nr:MAG: hypothetical protein UX10_C0001G0056 [Candidatus Magasanikbacteria bacterium GW2011_GWA2_45_39]
MEKSGKKENTCPHISISMFIGEYHHTVDEKGRVSIPVKFRTALKKGAVVTRGLDHSLFIYTAKAWEKLASKLASLPMGQADTRAFSRLMLAGAMELELDKQGRAIIPEYLRSFAGLKKQIVVAGMYDRLEVWEKEVWEKYKQGTEKHTEELAEKMGELGV